MLIDILDTVELNKVLQTHEVTFFIVNITCFNIQCIICYVLILLNYPFNALYIEISFQCIILFP